MGGCIQILMKGFSCETEQDCGSVEMKDLVPRMNCLFSEDIRTEVNFLKGCYLGRLKYKLGNIKLTLTF